MRSSRLLAAAAAAAALAAMAVPLGAATAAGPHLLFHIQPSEIDESSSLVVSQTHPGLVYTANDSGGTATVYVLDDQDGSLVGSTSLAGVDPVDIEAMATGPDDSLIVGDIGDNDRDHSHGTVYRIDEPGRGTATVTPDSVTITYSNGPRDAEAIVYDDASGRLFVVSKQFAGAHVYRSPRDFFSHKHVVMHPIARVPALATDAVLLPTGDVAVVRTYFAAYFYTFPGWHRLAERELPNQPQGESVAAPDSGDTLWIGSEGEHSRVLAVSVPAFTPPTPPPTSTTPSTTDPADGGVVEAENQHREQLKSRAVLIGGGALALLVVVIVVIAVRWQRHPHAD